jgi:dUTP pyrophosphatase
MATEQPENKKRKVSPEPDAGVSIASNLLIKRLSEKAKLPTRGSALAAGYDLYR